MPARQATPGPSTGIILQAQPTNSRKRFISEGDNDDLRPTKSKKVKQEQTEEIAVAKDRKRRKKKRRKSSIVVSAPSPSNMRAESATVQSQPRSVPPQVSAASPSSAQAPPDSGPPPRSSVEVKGEQDADPVAVSHIYMAMYHER